MRAPSDDHARTAAPRPVVLRLEEVDKTFNGATAALRRLSLTLREGELVTLLGPSGCGKSTALRLVAGLIRPTAGRVLWDGGPPGPGDLGMVFQEPTLMPWATVAENVRLPLRLAGLPPARVRARVEEALALVGLEAFAASRPRELSGGMRMRASIARALATRPRLVLMDEPFGSLDEITRHRLNDDLLALRAATGATVLFVTHSVAEAAFLSDRVLVMAPRPGRVAREVPVSAPAPSPRGPAWRQSDAYARVAREVSEALAAAMAARPATEAAA